MYLRGIVSEAYQNATVDPRRIIGEHNINMSTVDVLAGIRDGTLAQTVIDNMFQTLENERSTIALIDKTCRKLGLNVDSGVVDMAVNYLNIKFQKNIPIYHHTPYVKRIDFYLLGILERQCILRM